MNNKIDPDFVHFLQSMVSLDALHRMTTDLDKELKDSQAVMNQIKGMIDTLPARVVNAESEPDNSGLRHEDISNFLAAGTPQLLMPDMEANFDLNLDDVITTMKSYIENIKTNFTQSESGTPLKEPKQLESLELEQYASSLDQLCKRLSNLKINKKAEESCDTELDAKLSLLCDDVNKFTKMIQAKAALSESDKNWPLAPQSTNALEYDNLVNKLLTDIDGVSCLLRSRN